MEVIRKLKEIYKVSYEILIDNRVDLASASPQVSAKQIIQNSSLDEFANGDKGTDAFEFLDKLRGHYGR